MATLSISLPEAMKTFIDDQVADRGLETSSEYIQALVRNEQQRAKVRQMLLDGLNSGPGEIADADYFERTRQRIRAHRKDA